MIVGVNGGGKTTSLASSTCWHGFHTLHSLSLKKETGCFYEGKLGKLAYRLKNESEATLATSLEIMLVVLPRDDGIKFPCVAIGIRDAIQGKFLVGDDGPTWKKMSDEMKDYYFRE